MFSGNGSIQRAELAAAVEQAVDGIVITSPDGIIHYVNPAFTALTGYTREEAVGQNPRLLKSGRQPAAFYEEMWNTIRAGRVWHGELVNRRKDGSFYDEEMSISPVEDETGAITSYIAIKHDITERRAAQATRGFLAAIVEGSEDAVFSYAPAGEILTWNRGAEAIFGYPAQEALGMQLSVLLAPEWRHRLPAFTARVLEGQRVSQHQTWFLRKDGRRLPVSVTADRVRDPAGGAAAIAVIVRDITVAQEAEKEHALLASIVESSSDAIHAVALDGTILSWNHGAETLFGYASEEVVGRSVAILGPPERGEEVGQLLGIIREGRAVGPFDTTLQAKDGHILDVLLSISPIRNAAGEVVGAAGIAQNIGKRKLAERQLRESEERFREVFENAPFGMCVSRLDGRLIQVNAALCRMLGYSREELLSRTLEEVTHPDDWQMTLEALGQAWMESGRPAEMEKRYVRRDGEIVWARVRVSSMRDGGQSLYGPMYFVARVEDITERKRAQEALGESEQRFRIMADGCPAMMWVTGADGRSQFINRACREFFGASEEEVTGFGWQWFLHPEDAAGFGEGFQRAVRERARYHNESRFRRADGQWRWLENFAEPRLSSAGEYLGHVGMSLDITARKQAEDVLRESEQRFRSMADGCPAMMWVTDAGGGVEFVNRAGQEFIGSEWEQAAGSGWESFLHPEDVAESAAALDQAVRERKAYDVEARLRRADGEWRWFETFAKPRFSPGGEYLGHVGLSLDITARRQAEQALQSSETKFRQLAENIQEVFWMALSSGEILYVSPAYEQIWGRSCESLHRHPSSWMDAVFPEDREKARSVLARQNKGEPAEAQYRIRTPDGKEKWIRDRAFPIRDERGQLVRVAGIAEEITERKRYEEELIRAREGADAANRAKSCFLANMSHEIRTPMNGVIGMLQLLGDTDLSGEQRQFADVAQESGRTLLALIDDILDISKIEGGKLVLENRDFNLRETIHEVVRGQRVHAGAKGLDFHWRVGPEVPVVVRGDGYRLRQVLTNLTANAIKFTGRGSVRLEAALEEPDAGKVRIRFRVADTGIGIRADQVARLFSPFVQADESTTRKYGGTGLGLAISKQLVEMMGGSIGVESREGEGSTFWFTVVFEPASGGRQAAALPHRTRPEGDETRPAGRRGNILVAEDNATNREVAVAQLEKLGYQVSAVADGAEAVEAVRRGGCDLVLMDCQMPVMDGFEATRRIRHSSGAAIPIVAVTADAMPADRDRCLREGMDDYLAKPVELDPLAEVLARWLPGSGEPDAVRGSAREPALEAPAVVFDGEALLRRLMGDRRLAEKLLHGFLQDAPSQFDHLRRRLEEADAAGARLQAHALKGAAATVAAESLKAMAVAIERAGEAGELDRCGALLPRAVEEFARLKKAVQQSTWSGKDRTDWKS